MALFEGKPMSNVDAAWLHMEDPTNLMLITGVMSFYEKLDYGDLKELLEDRLLPFERFRKKVVLSPIPGMGPRWVTDKNFNLHSHLQRVALPDPGGHSFDRLDTPEAWGYRKKIYAFLARYLKPPKPQISLGITAEGRLAP